MNKLSVDVRLLKQLKSDLKLIAHNSKSRESIPVNCVYEPGTLPSDDGDQINLVNKVVQRHTFEKGQHNPNHSRTTTRKVYSNCCSNCGTTHPPRMCPAYGKQCNNCKKFNHFKAVCRSNKNNKSTKSTWINDATLVKIMKTRSH